MIELATKWGLEEAIDNIASLDGKTFDSTRVAEEFNPFHVQWPYDLNPPMPLLLEKALNGSEAAYKLYCLYFDVLGIKGKLVLLPEEIFISIDRTSVMPVASSLRCPWRDYLIEFESSDPLLYSSASLIIDTSKEEGNIYRINIPPDENGLYLLDSIKYQTLGADSLKINPWNQKLVTIMQKSIL